MLYEPSALSARSNARARAVYPGSSSAPHLQRLPPSIEIDDEPPDGVVFIFELDRKRRCHRPVVPVSAKAP